MRLQICKYIYPQGSNIIFAALKSEWLTEGPMVQIGIQTRGSPCDFKSSAYCSSSMTISSISGFSHPLISSKYRCQNSTVFSTTAAPPYSLQQNGTWYLPKFKSTRRRNIQLLQKCHHYFKAKVRLIEITHCVLLPSKQ